jgi:hypothetical protein
MISWASGTSAACAPLFSSWAAPQRVLDLVRQHPPQPHDRAQAVARSVDAQRPALDVQAQQHRPVPQRRGRAIGLEGRMAEEGDLHAALAHRAVLGQRPVDQRDERRVGRQGGPEATARQERQPLAEQRLRGLVHRHQRAFLVDHHGRLWAEVEGDRFDALQGASIRHRSCAPIAHA